MPNYERECLRLRGGDDGGQVEREGKKEAGESEAHFGGCKLVRKEASFRQLD